MKKISLLLAMLLCLVPVLGSCGANSSAKNAAKAAFEAYYVDGDADAYFEVALNYNVDLLKEYIDSDDVDDMKTDVRDAQKEEKDDIKELWDVLTNDEDDGGLGADDDFKVKGEVISCETYDDKTDIYDEAIESFEYEGSDLEDFVEEVAIVNILMTIEFTVDDVDYVKTMTLEYLCYNIDGDWYVGDMNPLGALAFFMNIG